MIEEQDLDTNFPNIISSHENKWVAIAEIEGKETVVGSGDDATEATEQAKARGYLEIFLFKVPSFHVGYIPDGRDST